MNTEAAFIDSNILLYWASGDLKKAQIAETIISARPTISVQVLNEFVAVSRKKHRAPLDKINIALKLTKVTCSVVSLSIDMHVLALEIAQLNQINIYDACIVAAAELAGCDTLYTEDLNDGQRIGSVTIRNPFI
jgi:predicted nucleic acid-binding protein